MRKIVTFFFIFIGLALLVLSTSGPAMEYLTAKRGALSGWAGIHHLEGAGDLVSMAYLDDVPKFYAPKDYQFIRPADTGNRNIDLYVYGDSYVREIPDSAFGHVSEYHFGRRDYTDLRYTLDHHKKNILIIEDAERFVRIYFQYLAIFDHVRRNTPSLSFLNAVPFGDPVDGDHSLLNGPLSGGPVEAHHPSVNTALLGIKADLFFNSDINHNLEFNMFGYKFMDRIKLFKASATYHFFGRASGDVVVSENGEYLFLRQTVAPHDILSSYAPVAKEELSRLVHQFNTVYDHYKMDGFDEVYLSIIPNPATILQPQYYNHLIPFLQKDPSLKMPVIDLYSTFANDADPSGLYRLGDTHWNNKGLQTWIRMVNNTLSELSNK